MSARMIQSPVQNGRHAGFGLIELMIAMVLGLLVLGAAIAVFQSNQRTFSANEGQNRIQEGARVAYELMSKDIRAAGGSACSSLARPDIEHTLSTEESAFLTTPVTGNASEVTVTSGDDSAYQIDSATISTLVLKAGQVDKVSNAFKEGDKLLLCNANHLYVVTVSAGGVDDNTRTLTFTPATPSVVTQDSMAPAATVAVARYRSTRWYLESGALKVQRDGGAGQEVITGVTAINVSFLNEGAIAYSATAGNVVAARVNLTLRGQKTTGGDVKVDGTNFITRNASYVTSLRSRTL